MNQDCGRRHLFLKFQVWHHSTTSAALYFGFERSARYSQISLNHEVLPYICISHALACVICNHQHTIKINENAILVPWTRATNTLTTGRWMFPQCKRSWLHSGLDHIHLETWDAGKTRRQTHKRNDHRYSTFANKILKNFDFKFFSFEFFPEFFHYIFHVSYWFLRRN